MFLSINGDNTDNGSAPFDVNFLEDLISHGFE